MLQLCALNLCLFFYPYKRNNKLIMKAICNNVTSSFLYQSSSANGEFDNKWSKYTYFAQVCWNPGLYSCPYGGKIICFFLNRLDSSLINASVGGSRHSGINMMNDNGSLVSPSKPCNEPSKKKPCNILWKRGK